MTTNRTRNVTTGRTINGLAEVIQLRDDGYRIRVRWISGRPDNVEDDDQDFVWAEYKQCNFPGIGYLVADLLFPADSTVIPMSWHHGPTATDPDPGKMWHYKCGGEVLQLEGGYVCMACRAQSDD